MKIFAPSKTSVGFHYHHFDQPVLPPLIGAPLKGPHAKGKPIQKKIVVYMGFEDVDDVNAFVQPFTDYEFQIFAKVEKTQKLGHINVNPLSHKVFHEQLMNCSGVISNAGFELSSEALSYGKKLLIKPLAGQYEQLCNALALMIMGVPPLWTVSIRVFSSNGYNKKRRRRLIIHQWQSHWQTGF